MNRELKCSVCGEMDADKVFLHENGWEHWYSSYWVRPDTVSDPSRQDFTNYQYSTEDAIKFTYDPKPNPYLGDLGNAFRLLAKLDKTLDQMKEEK